MELPIIDTLKLHPSPIILLSFLGLFTLFNILFSLLRWLYIVFLRPPKNLLHYGKWAVITGSTDGIGKALAFEISRRGLHLILVGRNPHKLTQVSTSIQAQNPKTMVQTVVVDFAGDLSGGIERLENAVRDLDVGLLVNNAGITYDYGTFLHEDDELLWRKIVKVNVEGFTAVTSAILPLMMVIRRGAIVNIGSGASTVIPSHPLFSVYASTKAYVNSLSRSLHNEYMKNGIDVQCQIPLYVATKMVSFKKSSFFTPSPMVYAEYSANVIGYEQLSMPYWPHTLQALTVKLFPNFLLYQWRLAYGLSRRRAEKSS